MASSTDTPYKLSYFRYLRGLLSVLFRLPSINKNIKKGASILPEDTISIGRILEENAVDYKNYPAILYEDKRYTHGEFNEIVNQYAHFFQARGVQHGDVIVVFLENTPATLFVVGAVAKIGAVASLINANQRGKVLKHSISLDMGDHFVIGEGLVAHFEEIREGLNLSEEAKLYWHEDRAEAERPVGYIDIEEAVTYYPTENPPETKTITAGTHFANVFTSGTTGMPKAGIQTQKKWLYCYYWYGKANLNLNKRDVIYVSIPFFHTNALIVAWPSAAAGGAAVAIRRKFSSSNFWKDIRKFDASAFIYIGEICRYLMNMEPSEWDRKHRVRKIVGNGLRPDIWQAFKKRFKISKVFELYGASDGNISFLNTLNIDGCVGWSKGNYAIIRYDVENEVPIRNSEGFCERVEIGQAGLLLGCITETAPFAGYVHKEKNEAKILRDVFEKGDQWFITGDLIRDIGYKHAQFVDRLGDTFRWKGENVSTAEVEEIVNTYPAVANSAVYGVKIPHTDGRAGLVAIKAEGSITAFDLNAFAQHLTSQLPTYAVPIFVRFLQDFETTATHKIRKFKLKQQGITKEGINDPMYIMLPKSNEYVEFDEEVELALKAREYAF